MSANSQGATFLGSSPSAPPECVYVIRFFPSLHEVTPASSLVSTHVPEKLSCTKCLLVSLFLGIQAIYFLLFPVFLSHLHLPFSIFFCPFPKDEKKFPFYPGSTEAFSQDLASMGLPSQQFYQDCASGKGSSLPSVSISHWESTPSPFLHISKVSTNRLFSPIYPMRRWDWWEFSHLRWETQAQRQKKRLSYLYMRKKTKESKRLSIFFKLYPRMLNNKSTTSVEKPLISYRRQRWTPISVIPSLPWAKMMMPSFQQIQIWVTSQKVDMYITFLFSEVHCECGEREQACGPKPAPSSATHFGPRVTWKPLRGSWNWSHDAEV